MKKRFREFQARATKAAVRGFRVLAAVGGAVRPAACAAAGVGLVAYGAWQIYRPLGPIVVGAVLIVEVLTSSSRREP